MSDGLIVLSVAVALLWVIVSFVLGVVAGVWASGWRRPMGAPIHGVVQTPPRRQFDTQPQRPPGIPPTAAYRAAPDGSIEIGSPALSQIPGAKPEPEKS